MKERSTDRMHQFTENLRKASDIVFLRNIAKSVPVFYLALLLMAIGATAALADGDKTISRSMEVEYEGELLASRGDTAISLKDVHGRILKIPAKERLAVLSDPERIAQLINGVLLVHYFADQQLEEVETLDEDTLVAIYYSAAEILARTRQNELVQESLLPDYTKRAREIYLAEPERFQEAEKVDFVHILLSNTNLDTSERNEKAASLRARISSGESFEELAPEHSDDPSVKQNKGKFNSVELRTLDPDFRKGLDQLNEGQLGVIESSFGTHLVRLNKRYPPRAKAFEEVAQELENEARRNHSNRIMQRVLSDFYGSPLQLEDGAVQAVINRYAD